MIVIVAYDIASDRRRTRLATALEAWGYRLQESLFQLHVSATDLAQVHAAVTQIIDADDDVVHVYPLCSACVDRCTVHGTAPALDDAGLYTGLW